MEMAINLAGAAFLGLRLRVIDQLIGDQGRKFLSNNEVRVPAVSISVFCVIAGRKRVNVTEIIDTLRISRQLVLQRLKLLEADRLILSDVGSADRRQRIIRLSPVGRAEFRKIERLIPKLEGAFRDLDKEVGVDLRKIFELTEQALRRRNLVERADSMTRSPGAARQRRSLGRG